MLLFFASLFQILVWTVLFVIFLSLLFLSEPFFPCDYSIIADVVVELYVLNIHHIKWYDKHKAFCILGLVYPESYQYDILFLVFLSFAWLLVFRHYLNLVFIHLSEFVLIALIIPPGKFCHLTLNNLRDLLYFLCNILLNHGWACCLSSSFLGNWRRFHSFQSMEGQMVVASRDLSVAY